MVFKRYSELYYAGYSIYAKAQLLESKGDWVRGMTSLYSDDSLFTVLKDAYISIIRRKGGGGEPIDDFLSRDMYYSQFY